MHNMDIKNRIDQFFDGALTYEEEQELYLYLCNNDVPVELHSDKEAVMAMCTDINDYTMPAHAQERLVQMLDALEDNEACVPSARAARKMPLFVWHSLAVAAVVIIAFIVVPSINIATADNHGIAYEQDTFDNPEEAMECVKSAFSELFIAVSATRQNAVEIGCVLEESAAIPNHRATNNNR